MKPEKPFVIRDELATPVATFATYGAAERAAIKWCRDKKSDVPIYKGPTRLANVQFCPNRGHRIDMTIAGSAFA